MLIDPPICRFNFRKSSFFPYQFITRRILNWCCPYNIPQENQMPKQRIQMITYTKILKQTTDKQKKLLQKIWPVFLLHAQKHFKQKNQD